MKLRAEHLVKKYKGKAVVNDVSVEVNQGEIVGLLGPNGAGKTTTFYMSVGLVKPNEGKVYLDGEDITKLPMYRRAKRGIGYLAQEPSVFRKLTIEENLQAVLELTDMPKREQKERADMLLEEFGLTEKRKRLGQVLSGGERRRTEIARALAMNPKFVLLDEPFAGVDPIAVEEIQDIVSGLKERNIGILITDHNARELLNIADRAYVMFEGQVFYSGGTVELANDPEVRDKYLGKNFSLNSKAEEVEMSEDELIARNEEVKAEFEELIAKAAAAEEEAKKREPKP